MLVFSYTEPNPFIKYMERLTTGSIKFDLSNLGRPMN